jgi:DNA-binding CsgD family transcriptional regulator/Flp pilus assembly protein TadD
VLIGRDPQVAVLARFLEQARSGQGQIALISGEAGIGKSRLVAETRKLADQQGFTILQGNCFERDRALPYAPLIDLLRMLPKETSLPHDLLVLLSGQHMTTDADPEQTKRRLFDALTRLLIEPRSPLIILEDLHWCDDTSLEFLLHLAHRGKTEPLLLLLTYRSDEITSPLQWLLAELDRRRLTTEVRLTRLRATDTAAMIHAIFTPKQPVRQEFAERIYTLTEGNPFFVEETLKALVTGGDIFYTDGGWTRKALDELHIPRTVQVAVAQRVAQLSSAARRLLTVAAVAGRRFDFSLLQAITKQDEAELIERLKELLHAQLVVEESAEGFAFRHALTQQAIYNDLLRRERKPLHRTVAEQIEQIYADQLENRLADLAFHYHCAEVWPKTLDYARCAGERARTLYAPQAALEHFTRALDALNQLPTAPVQQGELYRARGQVNEQVGNFEQARQDFERALAAVQTTEQLPAIWQAWLDLGFLWVQRDYLQAGEYFQQALTTARRMDDPLRLAHTLKRLGNWHMNVEQPTEAVAQLSEALRIFEGLADQRGVAETLDVLAIANYADSNAIDGSQHYAQAIDLFRQLVDRGGELNSLPVYAPRHMVYINNAACWPTVTVAERIKDGDAALTLARKLGAKPAEAVALIWPGNTLGISGAYGRALEQVQAGLALAETIDHLHFITTGHMVLSSIYWELLLWPEAQQHGERALAAARASKSLVWQGGILSYLASTLYRQGDWPAAERLLGELWHPGLPMRTNGQRQLWAVRIELLLAKREASTALPLLEQLIAADPHTVRLSEHAIPRLAALRGEALTLLGRYAEAEAALTAAQAFAQDAPPLLWRLYVTLGHCYRRQNRRDDADQAYAAARAILAQLAANIPDPTLRQRFVEQSNAQFPPPTEKQAAKQSAAGLTAKERQVTLLIGQGKSNKEIAEVMVVSHRTVETHVSNILSKLYLTSRAQIAVWAVEHGLTVTNGDE